MDRTPSNVTAGRYLPSLKALVLRVQMAERLRFVHAPTRLPSGEFATQLIAQTAALLIKRLQHEVKAAQ